MSDGEVLSVQEQLLEKLAKLEHDQWIHWMNYQNKKVGHITDMTVDEWYKQQETWQRWMRLAKTPYNKLTEKEKESDREWARKVLEVVKQHLQKQVKSLLHMVREAENDEISDVRVGLYVLLKDLGVEVSKDEFGDYYLTPQVEKELEKEFLR